MTQETNSNIRAKVWLEPTQVDTLRNACYDDTFASYLQQRNDAIIGLLYDSGLRVGELVQVDVEMLRDNNTALYLPANVQKDYPNENTPSAVTINLDSETTRTLNSYLASRWKETESLFPSRKSNRISEQGIRYMLHAVAETADVQPFKLDGSRGDPSDVTPHSLRHSVAYRMLHENNGNTLYDVRNRLRHRSIQTTERVYDHFRRV
ncbi:tyrosine-type recombinase/integrase [Halapricum hydrolyticum]|uniref:Site-specific integrase n=1 Tax=Halapricum hydrolyticum TaxID=2979991 RepID=A0AAE3IB71_9EURY|nr:site-specific integrase [Halapricum hydrolyticum]MCU4717575.1 site-specific integrase [Halapricum hydrolyticum]MCU4726896.1 site-specific integrase [Halapricum hydrolyticum]